VTDRLLTARQVAELLNVSAETVLRWTRDGLLPAVRLPGTSRGRLRYRPVDVEAWLDALTTATPVREAPATLSGAAGGRLLSVPPAIPPPAAASTEEEPFDATR
jgi:excisionase family DNA binding protein